MDKKDTHFTVKDIPAEDFIAGYAEYLKKNKKLVVPKVKNILNNSGLIFAKPEKEKK
tara:strand:- start:423 stop:593 length:171 start_codon:yes stop_codon:yes gene_type:complete